MLPVAQEAVLANQNRVTGLNNAPRAQARAARVVKQAQDVEQMARSLELSEIKLGGLYFAVIQKSEGELLVGLCTPVEINGTTQVQRAVEPSVM